LDVSGKTFIERWNAGRYAKRADRPEVVRVANASPAHLLTIARSGGWFHSSQSAATEAYERLKTLNQGLAMRLKRLIELSDKAASIPERR